MRVVCLYRSLDPRTKSSLDKYSPVPVDWVETPTVDHGEEADDCYARALEQRWDGDDDLMLVEQDKEIEAGTLEDMEGCSELWCGYTYWMWPSPHTTLAVGGFGVVRFSPQIRKFVPVSEFEGAWQQGIDRRFYDTVKERYGAVMHIHGHVVHHHVYEPRSEHLHRHIANLRSQGLVAPAPYPEPLDPGLLPGSYRLS